MMTRDWLIREKGVSVREETQEESSLYNHNSI